MGSPSGDLQALQGSWEQVYLEVDGVANPADEHTVPGVRTLICRNDFVVHRASGEVLLRDVFELDASTSPKSITWIDSIAADSGKRLPASYQIGQGGFIFFCG
jgi:uncharacterized protein (TIGR03067 family)